jgi:hypothetical protein
MISRTLPVFSKRMRNAPPHQCQETQGVQNRRSTRYREEKWSGAPAIFGRSGREGNDSLHQIGKEIHRRHPKHALDLCVLIEFVFHFVFLYCIIFVY